jgi:hypothetical protein
MKEKGKRTKREERRMQGEAEIAEMQVQQQEDVKEPDHTLWLLLCALE